MPLAATHATTTYRTVAVDGLDDKRGAPRRDFWRDRAGQGAAVRANFISADATRLRHVGTSPHPERYDPDLWTDEFAFLTRSGAERIQLDPLLRLPDQCSVLSALAGPSALAPPAHARGLGPLRPLLQTASAEAYGRDVPDAEIHLLDAGHFALDEATEEIACYVRDFLARNLAR
jgi:pimeloyl-ACP methyl ester carboxylesterase